MSFGNHSYPEVMCKVHKTADGRWEMPPQFYARLARSGLREAFNAEVERLKGEGVEHPLRWAEAAALFPMEDKVPEARESDLFKGIRSKFIDSAIDLDHGPMVCIDPDDKGKSLSALLPKDMLWLHRNIGGAVTEDDPAPSRMAAWFWQQALVPQNTSKVIDLVAKHLPPPKFMDERVRMEDDGTSVLELLDRIEGVVG